MRFGLIRGHRAQRAYQQETGVSYATMHVVPERPLTAHGIW